MTEKIKLEVLWADSESNFLQNAVQAAMKIYRERRPPGIGDNAREKPRTLAAMSRDDT